MKRILSLAVGLLLVGIGGIVEASSNPSLPIAVRQVNPLGTWTGTVSNPEYVTFSGEKTDTIDVVSEVTLLKAGTLTGIVNPVTVVQPTGSNLHTVIDSGVVTTVEKILAGTLTGIVNDVGIKDNGNSITIDSPQLPSALDANGNLKVHEQGTVNVKLDSNIDTALGKVKVTDGINVLGIKTDGSIDVNVLNQSAGGTEKFGVYSVSVGPGATVEIGSYTVPTGKTLYVKNFISTARGDIDFVLKIGGVNFAYFSTSAVIPSFGMNLGDTFSISAGSVASIVATNNEAVPVTVKLNWNGTEK